MKNIVVGLGLCALGSGLQAQEEDLPNARDIVKEDSDWKLLEQGEVVLLVDINQKASKKDRGNPAFYPTGAILIDSPVENVWNLINDKEAAPKYVQSLIRCRIVGRGSAHMMVEQEMKMNGFPGTFTYIVKHVMRPLERVDFERVSGDLRDIRGSWQFVPVEENTKTLLIYALHVDPGRFIPQGLVRKGMAKNLPKALLGIKTQVESAIEAER